MRVAMNDHVPSANPPPLSLPPAPPPGDDGPSFARVLRGLGRELDGGEQTMNAAMQAIRSDVDLPPGQLIALQARVYRYSEAVDLASRLVDRSAASIKTVLQGSGT